MAEVQQRYSANETAQLQALSDRLLSAFKEATLDLGKVISTKGLDVVRAAVVVVFGWMLRGCRWLVCQLLAGL